jgi:hypothetical protein
MTGDKLRKLDELLRELEETLFESEEESNQARVSDPVGALSP